MKRSPRVVDGWTSSTWAKVILIAVALFVGASVALGSHMYGWLTGEEYPLNPLTTIFELAFGKREGSIGLALSIFGAACVMTVIVTSVWSMIAGRGRRKRGDEMSNLTGTDVEELQEKTVREKAKRWGIDDAVGLPVGRTVKGGELLFSSFEDVCTLIAGMRTGKTTSWVIPRIMSAPGCVLVTSNKRDVVDATRYARLEKTAAKYWIFDPQMVCREKQECWWNPLSFVTDSTTAVKLANVFVDATTDKRSTRNDFFDTQARDLVAGCLLAAACAKRPITDAYVWINDETEDLPVRLLKDAGYGMWATRLQGIMRLVEETRSGVYGGAARILHFLTNENLLPWITPPPEGSDLEELDVPAFVRTHETLYCLSLEGGASAAPALAALTVAVAEAALEYGASCQGGRLPVPMLIELDEAANICPWRELPDMYSHFGSRGIVVDSILQSYAQGVDRWGESGMKKLWGPANLSIYLGGSKEMGWLRELSDLIGDVYEDSIQVQTSKQGSSTSKSIMGARRPIAPAADLAALPRGRGWVFASGATPVLIETLPWMTSEFAVSIYESIEESERTIA